MKRYPQLVKNDFFTSEWYREWLFSELLPFTIYQKGVREYMVAEITKIIMQSGPDVTLYEVNRNITKKILDLFRNNYDNLTWGRGYYPHSELEYLKHRIARFNEPYKLKLDQQVKSAIADLDSDKWGASTVAFAVAAKNNKRMKKGKAANIFVLERKDSDVEEKEGPDELNLFLRTLKENIQYLPDKSRFQLAIQTGVHWTACDIMVENGEPKFFLLDAVNSEAVKYIDNTISSIFPNSKMYSYVPDVLSQDAKTGEIKMRNIQFGRDVCAIFTLDHLFHLAKINPFLLLENANLKSGKLSPNFFRFGPDQCPNKLAFIFRNVQSTTVLNSLPQKLKKHVINKKQETLFDASTKHSKKVGEKNRLEAVMYKKKQMIIDTEKYLNNIPEPIKRQILQERNGIKYLKNHSIRLSKDQLASRKVSNNIIDNLCDKLKEYIVDSLNALEKNDLLPVDIYILKRIDQILEENKEEYRCKEVYLIFQNAKKDLSKSTLNCFSEFIIALEKRASDEDKCDREILSEIQKLSLSENESKNIHLAVRDILKKCDEIGIEGKDVLKSIIKNINKVQEISVALGYLKFSHRDIYQNSSINHSIVKRLIVDPSYTKYLTSLSEKKEVLEAYQILNYYSIKIDEKTMNIFANKDVLKHASPLKIALWFVDAVQKYGEEQGQIHIRSWVNRIDYGIKMQKNKGYTIESLCSLPYLRDPPYVVPMIVETKKEKSTSKSKPTFFGIFSNSVENHDKENDNTVMNRRNIKAKDMKS